MNHAPFKFRILSLTLISLHSLTGMTTAHAQDVATDTEGVQSLAPVVVSASKLGKLGETLEQLNGAANVADRLALDDAQVNSTLELNRVFPELYMSHSTTFLFPIITLRGVTSAQDFYNPALTAYVDGVPQLRPVFARD